mgnify:FL=1
MSYKQEITDLIVNSSAYTGKPLTLKDFMIVYQPLGHKPLKLPSGKMAVYTFVYNGFF